MYSLTWTRVGMNTCPCFQLLIILNGGSYHRNKTELALEMHRSALVTIRYTDADLILDCNVIVVFSNCLSVYIV